MTRDKLLGARLQAQKLARSDLRRPSDVVAWLGAAQAQDYPAAKWALGLRAPGLTDADVEIAFNKGTILRTHVLRPTWHFVTPADIRWMLALTGPRVNAMNAHNCRKLGIERTILTRSRAVLERALRDGTQLTRAELGSVLRRAGVRDADGQALGHVMMNAELEGVVCSGGRQGKQFTYALLEERAAPARTLTRDEALGELTRRYFTSHGPATLRDYVWWSGLTVGDARRGIDIVGQGLDRRVLDDLTYWSAATAAGVRVAKRALLLPNYDEYLIAHQDRDLVVGPSRRGAAGPRGSDVFAHSLILDGRLAGSWTRTVGRDAVAVDVVTYRRVIPADRRAVAKAAERYGGFMKQAVVCTQGLAR